MLLEDLGVLCIFIDGRTLMVPFIERSALGRLFSQSGRTIYIMDFSSEICGHTLTVKLQKAIMYPSFGSHDFPEKLYCDKIRAITGFFPAAIFTLVMVPRTQP